MSWTEEGYWGYWVPPPAGFKRRGGARVYRTSGSAGAAADIQVSRRIPYAFEVVALSTDGRLTAGATQDVTTEVRFQWDDTETQAAFDAARQWMSEWLDTTILPIGGYQRVYKPLCIPFLEPELRMITRTISGGGASTLSYGVELYVCELVAEQPVEMPR